MNSLRNRLRRASLLIAILLVACQFTACNRSKKLILVPVSGSVTKNGKPAANVLISFEEPKLGFATTASTETDGTYQLRSQYGNGVPPGEYQVTLAPIELRDALDNPIPPPPDAVAIPQKFRLPQTSGLTAIVTRESGPFKFDVKID